MNQIDLRVLHTLRCVGTTSTERLARATGLGEGVVTDSLGRLAESGSVVLDPGPFGGWSLTDEGRLTDVMWTEEELEAAGAREEVRSRYEQFLLLNPAVLQTCSDWQMRRIGGSVVLNDHDDADYDATVLSRLVDLDDAARVICDDLAEWLPRFDVYTPRLAFALERALAGETRYVADDMDSYHNVWFQMHEDLLTTLGLSRDEERRRA